eukprot:1801892-Rhodomonas_salina.2
MLRLWVFVHAMQRLWALGFDLARAGANRTSEGGRREVPVVATGTYTTELLAVTAKERKKTRKKENSQLLFSSFSFGDLPRRQPRCIHAQTHDQGSYTRCEDGQMRCAQGQMRVRA